VRVLATYRGGPIFLRCANFPVRILFFSAQGYWTQDVKITRRHSANCLGLASFLKPFTPSACVDESQDRQANPPAPLALERFPTSLFVGGLRDIFLGRVCLRIFLGVPFCQVRATPCFPSPPPGCQATCSLIGSPILPYPVEEPTRYPRPSLTTVLIRTHSFPPLTSHYLSRFLLLTP